MSYLSPVRKPPQALISYSEGSTYISSQRAEQGTHIHTNMHTHTETKHYDAIFGARKGNSPYL